MAGTYEAVGDAGPWALVEQYRRVQRYVEEEPDAGSYAVASALDLPRHRVRAWVDDGGRPNPVRGIDRAHDRGWIDREYHDPVFLALNDLVSWTFSGGSVDATSYRPRFSVSHDHDRDVLAAIFEGLGLTARVLDREGGRGTEVVPGEDATLLGRTLVALGAPSGGKADRDDLTLPEYLGDAPLPVQRNFGRIYVANRAQHLGRESAIVRLHEERSTSYLDELTELFRSIGDPDGVRRSGKYIVISQRALQMVLHGERNGSSYTDEEVIQELWRLDRLTDGPITVAFLREHGRISSSPLEHHFGSFTGALRAAGLTPSRRGRTEQ